MKKKNIIYFLLFITLNFSLLTFNSYAQWVQQSVPVTGGSFNDMKFANANTGFIINWNYPVSTLLRTTNTGYNWQTMNNWGMAHIIIVDTGCIYTSGQNDFGKIYKSSNLGVTWDSMLTTTSYYSYLHFFNRDTGLISGGNSFINFIWRTTNGCQSIQLIATYGGASPCKFFFLKEKINGEYCGWLYYPQSSLIYRTTNSGLNWTQFPDIPGLYGIRGLCFVNKDTGWVSITNSSNFVYYTTNGGLNWANKIMPYNSVLHYDIWFVNPNTGWIMVQRNCFLQIQLPAGLKHLPALYHTPSTAAVR
ncbi:MAG: hypothetical protein MUE56_04265 [Ignavibacteria bacterium]|nr:hypothetical protein [Ignavibacteria bacterium]